ncbi:hypothetical protein SEMRO_38_G023780.1 [Seminavis robusta]|uniref:Uncharacterized protein n=1 Tax=Seminavis robusta TaxID=568900 RepID=A0A9N8H3G0_9STRA|nr:hypothetical protein SEMRO_38_G023780.1 [Seminavis robusta]|eukprot:Sro38_g023780.1 n/a (501) ;mRNA; r:93552-95054
MFFKRNPSICDQGSTNNKIDAALLLPQPDQEDVQEEYEDEDNVDFTPFLTQADTECHSTPQDDDTVDSNDSCIHDEGVLNCYFHVTHAFATKRSYVKKMRNPVFAQPKGTAHRHVRNIACTKTPEQRRCVTDLYMTDWRTNRGEKAAADHLEKEYCQYPKWNWNYYCTGEVGCYPTNCPNESFNRHGIKSICEHTKNASLGTFLVQTIPALLRDDAFARSDPCTIEIPRSASVLAVAVAGYYREGLDIIPLGRDGDDRPSSWIANLHHKIGVPLDERRRLLIAASLDGDTRPFMKSLTHRLGKPPLQDSIADAMVSATVSVCHLSWKDGNIVGDCEECVKHLGYNCPAAIYLRSRHGLLDDTVENLRKTNANRNGTVVKSDARGSTKGMYTSGLSRTGSKRRCLPKMLNTFESYLGTLTRTQLVRVLEYLRLHPKGKTVADFVRKKTHAELLEVLIAFFDNPTAFRTMRDNSSGEKTSYEIVKSLACKVKSASKENNGAL